MKPDITLVIPTHNRAEMLAEAVKSVLNQTHECWELIIIDDGSTDNTAEVASTLEDARIRVLRNEHAQGVSAARNRGLDAALAEHVGFLDDDDKLRPTYVQLMLEAFARHGQAIDFAWPILVQHLERKAAGQLGQDEACEILAGLGSVSSFLAASTTRASGMVFRRATLQRLGGFDQSLAVSEDRDLVFRLLSAGCGCVQVGAPLVDFYVHDGPRLSTSQNLKRQAECDQVIATRHKDFLSAHPKLAARFLNRLARRQRAAGMKSQARNTLKQIIVLRPFDLRARKRLLQWR